jgi:iron complex transport system ATP-binding protein
VEIAAACDHAFRVSAEPVLELLDATVIKGDRPALAAITLIVRNGEHTAILGPNGAGKSVLVNLLTHQDRARPTADGASPVRVFGEDRWNVFELRSRLGIVSADLHRRFVQGNSEGRVAGEAAVLSGFFASQGILRHGVVTDQMRQQAADALARMGVAHLARRPLNEMSTGEARRVMLARALATAPRALVLDEPTTGLDVAARHSFMERVRQIAREGTTIILVTHHLEEIIPEIDRVVLLRAGRIAGDGTKRSMLTADRLSDLFEVPIALDELNGYYHARV